MAAYDPMGQRTQGTQTPPFNPGPPMPKYGALPQFQFGGYGQPGYQNDPAFQQGWTDTFNAIGGLDPASRARVEEAFKAMGPIQPGMGRGIDAWRKAYNSVVDPQMSQEGTQTPPIWPGADQGAKGGGPTFSHTPSFADGMYNPNAGQLPGMNQQFPGGFNPPPPGFGGTNPRFQTGGGFQSRPPIGGQGPVFQRPPGGDSMYKPPRPTRGPRMTKPNERRQMRPRPQRRPGGMNPRTGGY